MEQVWQYIIIIQVVNFLGVIGVFLFPRKYFEELGKQNAKHSFKQDLIVYQIHNAKYIELRFQRLDELYGKIYELKKYCPGNSKMFFHYADKQGFQNRVTKFYEYHEIAEDALYRARLYITDDKVSASVKNFLDKTSEAFQKFTKFCYDAIEAWENRATGDSQPQEPIERDQSLTELLALVHELPDLLTDIEREFKRHLTVQFNDKHE